MSEGSSLQQLPQLVDPRKFAFQSISVKGIVPEEKLSRLQDVCVETSLSTSANEVYAELDFFCDDEGRRCISGRATARVYVECQRCLEPFELAIATEVNLAVVWDEAQAQALPKSLDPWILDEETGDLYSMLEEELLLSLPTVALHDFECIEASAFSVGDKESVDQAGTEKRNNPFDVLASLKPGAKD